MRHVWSDYGSCNYGYNVGYDDEGDGSCPSFPSQSPLAYVGGKTQIPQAHPPEYPEGTSLEWAGRSSPALSVLGPGGLWSAQEKAAGGGESEDDDDVEGG